MNLLQFLKQIDSIITDMKKKELEDFIHEIARTLPENRRESFLKTLETVSMGENKEQLSDANYAEELSLKVNEIIDILTDINDGTRSLESEYNEEWDDWYNPDVPEVLFSDPEHLLPEVREGIQLLHSCMDAEEYDSGCQLAELLSALEVPITGDYEDYYGCTSIDVHDLYENSLLDGRLEDLLKEALFMAYMGNILSDRPDEMYCMMGNFRCYDIRLEEVMQLGDQDLPEFHEFLPLWIDYLGTQKGRDAERLLSEAQGMLTDEGQLLENARKYVDQHPQLYKQILEDGIEKEDNERLYRIGLEAMEKIPENKLIRSEIALLTSEYAYRSNQRSVAEYCWLEAFRSDTSVMNYMRLRFRVENWNNYKKLVREIYIEARNKTRYSDKPARYDYDALQSDNKLQGTSYYFILFFEGNIKTVIREGMCLEKPLGWSSTFMKEGLSLLLLLLYEETGELSKGLQMMLSRVVSASGFDVDSFCVGEYRHRDMGKTELFWSLFSEWKDSLTLSHEDAEEWLQFSEQLIAKRTAGIMEANRRNYYGECAAFIAALGEVKESRGLNRAKMQIMEQYKKEYSRRRAFHQELRYYGMKN